MANLNIAIVQAPLRWEAKTHNLHYFSDKITAVNGKADLIVLPEMFTTGFSMDPERLAEPIEGDTVLWMQNQALVNSCVITGSFICKEGERYFNRLVWAEPDGTYQYYDKRHLFSMGNEHEFYHAGTKKIIVSIKGWKICPLVCYDLRFPVWSRNEQGDDMYDVLIYIANWPAKRAKAWNALLMARAIENQAYVVGVNRIGEDGNGIDHSGDSQVLNALGERISNTLPNSECTEIVTLNYSELYDFRKSFPVLLDGDSFNV